MTTALHLRYHIRWLQELAPAVPLTRLRAAWLFALCAAVSKPLDPDTLAALRALLRCCAHRRATKVRHGSGRADACAFWSTCTVGALTLPLFGNEDEYCTISSGVMLQGALVVRTSSQGLATATLVPGIQGSRSCVSINLSDQKIYLKKIFTRCPQ